VIDVDTDDRVGAGDWSRLEWMERWPRSHPRTTGPWTIVRPGAWATLDPETGQVTPATPERDRRLPGLGPALADGGRLVAYRVGRRAVVGDRGRWVKVVRPSRLVDLVATHARLDTALGPVGVETPRVLAQDDDGRLELSTVSGESLHQFLRTYGPRPRSQANGDSPVDQALTEVARGLAALHRLPVEGPAPLVSSAASDSLQRAIGWVARVEPATVDRLWSVAATLPQPSGGGPTSMIHGDLHDKNVFVGSDGRVGLIDLDGVGHGSSVDDVANLAVHLELRAMQAGLDRSIGRTWSQCLTDAYARLRPFDADDLGIRRRHIWFRLACLYRFRRPGRELTDRLLALAVDDR